MRWRGLLALLVLSLLQGCLLSRVMETRAQLCDDQPPRVRVVQVPGASLRVVFDKPTLSDRDVIGIVGVEPSGTSGTAATRELVYEARPLDRPADRTAGLVSRLSFVYADSEYRLAQVEVPEKFNAVLPPALLAAAANVACKAQIMVAPPSTTFDLAPLDRTTLPGRDALRQLLGPPDAGPVRNGEMTYRYCLMPCDAGSPMVTSLKFSFDIMGWLERAEASYFRYSATVDLVSSTPKAKVELH